MWGGVSARNRALVCLALRVISRVVCMGGEQAEHEVSAEADISHITAQCPVCRQPAALLMLLLILLQFWALLLELVHMQHDKGFEIQLKIEPVKSNSLVQVILGLNVELFKFCPTGMCCFSPARFHRQFKIWKLPHSVTFCGSPQLLSVFYQVKIKAINICMKTEEAVYSKCPFHRRCRWQVDAFSKKFKLAISFCTVVTMEGCRLHPVDAEPLHLASTAHSLATR